MKIFIRKIDGNTMTYEVESNSTIANIWAMIHEKEGFFPIQ
jgi:hypothetical protein